MKQTVLHEYYKDGHTKLIMENKYGVFSAECNAVDEDVEIANKWDGFRLCEYKIMIQTLKAKAKALQERVKGMKHMENVWWERALSDPINENVWCDTDWRTVELFSSLIDTAQREVDKTRKQVKEMKEAYPAYAEYLISERKHYSKLSKNFNDAVQKCVDEIEAAVSSELEL